MADLTNKQKLFIKEYLIDLNATQAAIRAGYSVKTANEQASRMLANVNISNLIKKELETKVKKLDLSAEWVLNNLKTVAERCMQAEEVMTFNYQTKQLEGTGEYRFDSIGANKALELLGKYFKLFTDKVEVDGSVVVFKGDDKLED